MSSFDYKRIEYTQSTDRSSYIQNNIKWYAFISIFVCDSFANYIKFIYSLSIFAEKKEKYWNEEKRKNHMARTLLLMFSLHFFLLFLHFCTLSKHTWSSHYALNLINILDWINYSVAFVYFFNYFPFSLSLAHVFFAIFFHRSSDLFLFSISSEPNMTFAHRDREIYC